jgi:hypothetical protein
MEATFNTTSAIPEIEAIPNSAADWQNPGPGWQPDSAVEVRVCDGLRRRAGCSNAWDDPES